MTLVILDRDGVINFDSDAYIKSAAEWRPIPGSLEAIARLSQAGFTVAVATNQSGLGRGLFNLDDLEAMHAKMEDMLATFGGRLAGVFYCPHHPDDLCECRKPKAGLIDAIEAELGLKAEGAVLVGDSLRDLEAGAAKGCQLILVRTGKGEKTLATLPPELQRDVSVYDDLAAAVNHLLDSSTS